MRFLYLGKGEFTIVDDEDYFELNRHKWHVSRGYVRKFRPGFMKDPNKVELMHRTIIGAKDGEIVDHINGNKLDNRRKNLRIVSVAQNAYNRGKFKASSSKFKGVSLKKGKWVARIKKDGNALALGTFTTEEAAAAAYNEAARNLYGEYARLNNI